MKKTLSLLGFGILVALGSNTAEAIPGQCTAELVGPRGRVIEVVVGRGYDRQSACSRALQNCQRAMHNGRHRRGGRGGRLSCRVVRPMVVRTCSARPQFLGGGHGPRGRRGPRGGRGGMRVFTASARGALGSGVYALACQNALRRCSMVTSRIPGPRRISCIADNGAISGRGGRGTRGGGHIDPIPTPPRRDGAGAGNGRRGSSRGGRGTRGGHQ